MTFGFAPLTHVSRPASDESDARLGRMLELSEWASAGIPLLRNPREVVTGLHERHRPVLTTAIVAVLDPQQRVTASASFTEPAQQPDGWQFRNVLLAHLRRIVPHDLRLRVPVRTAVLLYCREGEPRWTQTDGAWMWGLRDACTLHGLRCGAYITLTRDRWQVLGENRGGRRPRQPREKPVQRAETALPAECGDGGRAQRGSASAHGESDHASAPSRETVRGVAVTSPVIPAQVAPAGADRPSGASGTPLRRGVARSAPLRSGGGDDGERSGMGGAPVGGGVGGRPGEPERAVSPPASAARLSAPPRQGVRAAPRRTGGGAPEAQRHTAAR